MRRFPWAVWVGLYLLLAGSPRRALASAPVADPGFAFVDVNGDGLYSAADGDIGLNSTPGVDINALIQSSGSFDTGVSTGAYHAPSRPASLVIPASQTISVSVALYLKAGVNLIVHGRLNAPSMTLQAWKSVDLTISQETFTTLMIVYAGGDAILNGASVGGSVATSRMVITACGNLYANQANGLATGLTAGASIGIAANGSASLDGAALLTYAPKSSLMVGAVGDVKATDFTTLSSSGSAAVMSRSGNVLLSTGACFGNSLSVTAWGDANVTDSSFQSSGQVTLQAGGHVTGNSPFTSISAAAFSASGSKGVDVRSSAILATAGLINLLSGQGPITVNSVNFGTAAGLTIHAQGSISALGAVLNADHVASFVSDSGAFSGAGSTIRPFTFPTTSAPAGTSLSVTAPGLIDGTSAHWTEPAKITLQSTASNVSVPGATLQTTQPSGQIQFSAAGGTINILGANLLSGSILFGPAGVTVLGP